MSDTNVLSLISETIAILETTAKQYNIVNGDKGLPEAFHEAGRGLILVQAALQTADTQLRGRSLAGDVHGALSSLEACTTKAKLSESIFKDIAKTPKTSRFERYKVAVQQEGKGQTVEVLTLEMMEDVCALAENGTIRAKMEDQVNGLRNAIDKLSKMEPSVPKKGSSNTFNNYGPGNQFNSPGGTQNNNTGSGSQFLGNFSGPVHFGSRGHI